MMQAKGASEMSDREQQIRRKAYELWEAAGRPEGRQAEHWAEAERQLAAEDFSTGNTEAADPQQMQSEEAGSIAADPPARRRRGSARKS